MEAQITARTRKLGYGYSCTPTGDDAYSIETPGRPDYVGTFRQIRAALSEDRTHRSLHSGGTYTNEQWFYRGRRITHYSLDGTTWYRVRRAGDLTLELEDMYIDPEDKRAGNPFLYIRTVD